MKKRYIGSIVVISLIAGVFLAKPIESIEQIFRTEKEYSCATENICVGEEVSVIHGLYESDPIGGLNAIFCGKVGSGEKIEYLFVRNILKGESCDAESYGLDFRTDVDRTVIYVVDGVIVKITQGPLHSLDL